MIRTLSKTLMAGLLATTLGSTAMVAPAAADGSFSISFAPRDAHEERALRNGLQLYSFYNAVRGGASIRQIGRNNAAGIGQNGRRNLGIVHQEGRGHTGTLQQNGNRNSYGLFQFGRNTSANVVQNGNGGSGATFQFGW